MQIVKINKCSEMVQETFFLFYKSLNNISHSDVHLLSNKAFEHWETIMENLGEDVGPFDFWAAITSAVNEIARDRAVLRLDVMNERQDSEDVDAWMAKNFFVFNKAIGIISHNDAEVIAKKALANWEKLCVKAEQKRNNEKQKLVDSSKLKVCEETTPETSRKKEGYSPTAPEFWACLSMAVNEITRERALFKVDQSLVS
jgi:hypothetical protein